MSASSAPLDSILREQPSGVTLSSLIYRIVLTKTWPMELNLSRFQTILGDDTAMNRVPFTQS